MFLEFLTEISWPILFYVSEYGASRINHVFRRWNVRSPEYDGSVQHLGELKHCRRQRTFPQNQWAVVQHRDFWELHRLLSRRPAEQRDWRPVDREVADVQTKQNIDHRRTHEPWVVSLVEELHASEYGRVILRSSVSKNGGVEIPGHFVGKHMQTMRVTGYEAEGNKKTRLGTAGRHGNSTCSQLGKCRDAAELARTLEPALGADRRGGEQAEPVQKLSLFRGRPEHTLLSFPERRCVHSQGVAVIRVRILECLLDLQPQLRA